MLCYRHGLLLTVAALTLACGGMAPPEPTATPAAAPAEPIATLTPVEGISLTTEAGYVAVAAGSDVCGVDDAGSLICHEGLGARGFGGDPHTAFSIDGHFKAPAAGSPFSGGIRSDGALVGKWRPGLQELSGEFTSASFGDGFACGIDGGAIRCLELEGGLTPPVPEGTGFVSVAGDGRGGCALDTEGLATCWEQWAGVIPADQPLTTLAVGRRWACGLDPAGAASCWGEKAATVQGSWTRIGVAGIAGAACALNSKGTVVCWNNEGVRYAVEAAGSRFTDLAVGRSAACALRSDGALYCWPLRQRPPAP